MAYRSVRFESGSPPPCLAATMIALLILVHTLPRRLSTTALRCLILLHLLWPAKGLSYRGCGLWGSAGFSSLAGREETGFPSAPRAKGATAGSWFLSTAARFERTESRWVWIRLRVVSDS